MKYLIFITLLLFSCNKQAYEQDYFTYLEQSKDNNEWEDSYLVNNSITGEIRYSYDTIPNKWILKGSDNQILNLDKITKENYELDGILSYGSERVPYTDTLNVIALYISDIGLGETKTTRLRQVREGYQIYTVVPCDIEYGGAYTLQACYGWKFIPEKISYLQYSKAFNTWVKLDKEEEDLILQTWKIKK